MEISTHLNFYLMQIVKIHCAKEGIHINLSKFCFWFCDTQRYTQLFEQRLVGH